MTVLEVYTGNYGTLISAIYIVYYRHNNLGDSAFVDILVCCMGRRASDSLVHGPSSYRLGIIVSSQIQSPLCYVKLTWK